MAAGAISNWVRAYVTAIRPRLNAEQSGVYRDALVARLLLVTSWMADSIDRRGADVIFLGYALHGSPFGRTKGKIAVRNVSRFVQLRYTGKPHCLIEQKCVRQLSA